VQEAIKVAAVQRPLATTQPRVAAVRALIDKQHTQASRGVAVLSFNRNTPRAPHVVLNLGLLGKKKTSRSLVDEKFAAWIYNTMQSFDVAGHDLKELVSYIIKYAPKDYVPPLTWP
jgi:hypothetical protein